MLLVLKMVCRKSSNIHAQSFNFVMSMNWCNIFSWNKIDLTLDLDYSKKKKKIVGRLTFWKCKNDNSFWLHDVEWSETFNKLKKLNYPKRPIGASAALARLLLSTAADWCRWALAWDRSPPAGRRIAGCASAALALSLSCIDTHCNCTRWWIRTTFAITNREKSCQKKDNNFIIYGMMSSAYNGHIYGNNGKHGQYDWNNL